ncbi:MAG: hypothetical protein GWO20_00775 [Candidatus Korarchaeota archaeon]|nr:hypothetical protein [Candidatus Korarchaeota archaeon]NIU82115.1 hypothetical protein [Candidatus Thorarchaeota archaeon]NIW12526.1 hypothetical protein [Candidatus Thorarchaeota archaeon]NIW50745.1 hypothetical protein [Candidatus Korarchaeota archaeon]
MVRLELFEYYNRKIGAFCSSIPAVFDFIIIILGGTLGVDNLINILVTFGPLIPAGYYFDVIFESPLIKLAHYLFLRLVLSWMLLFTLSQYFGLVVYGWYANNPIGLTALLNLLPFSLFLGAIYGFLFMVAYLYVSKVYYRFKLRARAKKKERAQKEDAQ